MEELKYCRHCNRKTKEGGKHSDRDAQFEYINAKAAAFQAADQPVISIDAKKKELLGEFKNGGSDYGPQGQPIEVNTDDFEDKELGKFIPYGIYDTGANLGYVSLGIDHDTGQFAVNGVRLWLDRMGRERYPSMTRLMITADGGGSNGSRLRLWKVALQQRKPYSARNAMLGWYHTYGSIAFALGRLAALIERFDEAKAHFETALAANGRIRATVALAHAECELAKLLLARAEGADAERAGALTASARRRAEALNLVRVKQKLERLGADRPAPAGREPVAATGGSSAESGARVEAPSLGGAPIEPKRDALDEAASALSRNREVRALASLDGTVTIMFSDIVGSTALYEKLGDLRGSELVRTHNEIFRREVAAYRGHEVQTFGDGFMIAFSSVRRAVLCAIALQRAFAAYCEGHPDLPIKIRIGLHVGEAVRELTDFFGKSVILAARISGLAEGGQILASSTIHDVAASAGDLRFAPVGERPLKGLAGTHRLYELVW